MLQLIRFWFTYDGRVDRRTYLLHGFALALLKYAIDAALIWMVAGVVWTPVDYLAVGMALERSKLAGAATSLHTVLALWALPFVWIGHSMSLRRSVDAGVSPWLSLLFFIPLVNYPYIALLCARRSVPREVLEARRRRQEERAAAVAQGAKSDTGDRVRSELRAVALGTIVGVATIGLGVLALNSYGASLFFGAPFVIGALTAYDFNRTYDASRGQTLSAVVKAVLLAGLAMLLFAMEGAVCLVMALPLALGVACMGATMGRWIAHRGLGAPREAFLAILLVPASIPIVDARHVSRLREVRSRIEIDAPAESVWRNVIAFPRLEAPTDWIFRSGISYPIGARIEGTGVGAMRYCEFSTGAFVEPITHWEPAVRLAFDVTQQPPPMHEWSPYDIAPPHLEGFFAARRGEFRLIPLPGGRTRLEGSTWYELQIGPEVYWSVLADAMVHRIHLRVLRHISATAERRS